MNSCVKVYKKKTKAKVNEREQEKKNHKSKENPSWKTKLVYFMYVFGKG